MANITLDSLRKSVDDRFQKLNIEDLGVVFENPMRRDSEGRTKFREDLNKLIEVGKTLKDESDEAKIEAAHVGAVKDLLRSVCVEGDFDALDAGIDGDALIWNELFGKFMETLKVGEASASQS